MSVFLGRKKRMQTIMVVVELPRRPVQPEAVRQSAEPAQQTAVATVAAVTAPAAVS